MCLNIPAKIVSIRKRKIIIDQLGKKRYPVGSLVKTKRGDYVLLQNNFIVAKVSRKEAKEIIDLTKK